MNKKKKLNKKKLKNGYTKATIKVNDESGNVNTCKLLDYQT